MAAHPYRIIKIPQGYYFEAREMQKTLTARRGVRVPMWECLLVIQQNKPEQRTEKDPFDPLRRIRL